MNRTGRCCRAIVTMLASLCGILPTTAIAHGGKGTVLAVIVSAKIRMATLNMGDLRKIYQGDKSSWSSGQKVTILMPSGTRERGAVLRKILQMTDAQYKQFWIAKVFRAEAGGEPRLVSSEKAGDTVKKTVGAIACVDAYSVPAGVKTLKIEGKAPDDPGYPL